MPSDKALEIVDWHLKKSNYHKKHYSKERFPPLPKNMERVDMIRVNFGLNIGDEFSDNGVSSHFAIYWAQNGYQIVVIPISSQERQPEKNSYAVNIGHIPGLPKDSDSYAKIDMLRSINIRRISKITGKSEGKISLKTIKPDAIQAITEKIIEKMS